MLPSSFHASVFPSQWQSVPRTDLFEGFCSVKTGVGPGSFTKWRCVYIVENQDYNLEIYSEFLCIYCIKYDLLLQFLKVRPSDATK